MDQDPKKSRHWPAPEQLPREENPYTRDTKPEQRAVDIPARARSHDSSVTLMAVEEAFAKRLKAFGADLRDDMRAKDQRIASKIDAVAGEVRSLSERLEQVESGTQTAVRDSSASLEKSRDAMLLITQIKRLHDKLDAQPKSEDVAREFKQASGDATAEFVEMVESFKKSVKKWIPIGAAIMGVIAGAATYMSSHGTAKEAATTAVQEAAPKTPQLPPGWVVIQPAPQAPAPVTTGSGDPTQ